MTATEPERWLVADDEVAHQLRPALRMARGGGPSASQHARMWDGLALKLAVEGGGGAEHVERAQPAASASPAAAAEGGGKVGPAETELGSHPGWWWITGTAIFAAAFGFVGARFIGPSETNARVANPPPVAALPRESQRAEPPAQASPPPSSLNASSAEPVEVRSRGGRVTPKLGARPFRPPQRSAANAEAGTNITGELDLLARARRVVASNPARALQLTAEHGRRYQDGVLAQEREVLAIGALSRLGHRDLAVARARRFIAQYPDSTHRVRLAAELEAP